MFSGAARLFYVRRRDYQPKDSALAAFPASYATVGLAPGQTLAVRRDVGKSFHRALPWIFIGAGAGFSLLDWRSLRWSH